MQTLSQPQCATPNRALPLLPPATTSVFTGDSPNLDFLRAYAVLLVLVYHLAELVTPGLRGLCHLGAFGVLIFFVHTSLVLMLSLERTKEKGTALFAAFYVRRFFRIYPLSVVTVVCAVGFGYRVLSRPDVISNLALTMNLTLSKMAIDPLWSLPYEIQMYLFLPFLFLFARRFRSAWTTVALLVATVGLALVQPILSPRLDIVQYAGCFLPGIIAYQLSSRPRYRWNVWIWPVVLVSTTLLFTAVSALHLHHGFVYRWIACLIIGLAVPQFQQLHDGIVRRAAKVIAKYSYGIYLMHMFALHIAFVKMAAYPAICRWSAFILMMVVFPVGAFHLIEHPGLLIGKRIAQRVREICQEKWQCPTVVN